MLFSSPRFLIFLAVTLIGLALIRGNGWRKRFLALGSCFFYAAWDWRFLGLLLLISVIDYWAAWKIARAESDSPARKRWLLLSVVSNLGVLGYFKYANFFIENFNILASNFGGSLPAMQILLPAGISFYTFKTMSYTIDVYRGSLQPVTSWIDYVTFITFFPELIAGPIVRGSVFLPQMDRKIGPTRERLLTGGSIFFQGLVKKLLIADRMAITADLIFASPELFGTMATWHGLVAYTIQIYCDFSGYSDMAIGIARMIGYDLPENFRMPYLSRDVSEFWTRWHITLSAWLKDYLYIPLGGNRGGELLTYRNLFITMLLGGLWHGASWNFVLWGGMHGAALAVHKLWRKVSNGRFRLFPGINWALTFLFVMLTWVPFRATTMGNTVIILKSLVGIGPGNYQWTAVWVPICAAFCLIGHLVGWRINASAALKAGWADALARHLGFQVYSHPVSGRYLFASRLTVMGVYLVCMAILTIVFFAPLETNPFIYFQF